MSDPQTEFLAILTGQLERLLDGKPGASLDALWPDLESLGLPLAMVPEAQGGSGLGWAEFAAIGRVLGAKAAAVPLGETILANKLLSAAGLPPAGGPAALLLEEGGLAPWGGAAGTLVLFEGENMLARIDARGGGIAWTPLANMAGEPRDRADWQAAADTAERSVCPLDGWEAKLAGALLRAAQMAGALGQSLALCVEYANLRVQFGRPIGKFQAVQHMIAELASETAAAGAGVEAAARAADRDGLAAAAPLLAAAKVRAGMAAGKGAALAQQVHGAMGFTEEYPLGLLSRRLWSWRDEMGSEKVWAAWLGRKAIAAPDGLWHFLSAS